MRSQNLVSLEELDNATGKENAPLSIDRNEVLQQLFTLIRQLNPLDRQIYRAELERQRNFHGGMWFWSRIVIFTPGPPIFMTGFTIAHPALAKIIRVDEIAILLLLAIPLNLRLAHKYQRQINKLDDREEHTANARS